MHQGSYVHMCLYVYSIVLKGKDLVNEVHEVVWGWLCCGSLGNIQSYNEGASCKSCGGDVCFVDL
jgi:hypothetical protein